MAAGPVLVTVAVRTSAPARCASEHTIAVGPAAPCSISLPLGDAVGCRWIKTTAEEPRAALLVDRLEPNRRRWTEPVSYAKALRSLPKKLSGEAEAALGRWL